jgi:hypothetical protein
MICINALQPAAFWGFWQLQNGSAAQALIDQVWLGDASVQVMQSASASSTEWHCANAWRSL